MEAPPGGGADGQRQPRADRRRTRRNGGAPRRGRGPRVVPLEVIGPGTAAMEAPPGGGADSRLVVLQDLGGGAAMEAPPGGGADQRVTVAACVKGFPPQWRRPPEGARTGSPRCCVGAATAGRNGGAPRRGRGLGALGPAGGELEPAAMEAPPGGGADAAGGGGAPVGGRAAAMEAPPGGGADRAAKTRERLARIAAMEAPPGGGADDLPRVPAHPEDGAAMEAPPGGGADVATFVSTAAHVNMPQWRRPPEGARTRSLRPCGRPPRGRNGGAPRRGRGPDARRAGRAPAPRRNGGAPRRGRGPLLVGPPVERQGDAAMEAPPGGGADSSVNVHGRPGWCWPQWRRPPEGARTRRRRRSGRR